MLDHISIGVRDLQAAKRFYDAALKPLGYICLHEFDGSLGYGAKTAGFWSAPWRARCRPIRNPVCISASRRRAATVSGAFHAAALKAGGRDNGQPGVRTDYGPHYYAAFVIDPDGYRIETYCGDA